MRLIGESYIDRHEHDICKWFMRVIKLRLEFLFSQNDTDMSEPDA